MEKFRIRPAYTSEDLLVEFWGDHRGAEFPDIAGILATGLKATPVEHPSLDTYRIAIATDELLSYWRYGAGEYELANDIWGFFILAPVNNARVIADVERVLLASGKFQKEAADFSEYR